MRDLENLYRGMWEEFQGGRRPVPDLSNLDAYHNVGVEIASKIEPFGRRRRIGRLYRDKLEASARDRSDPANSRLWGNGN